MNPTADTPMWRQFRELKAQVPDALLFFRMGDFYELFGDDAVWVANALELTLTSRNKDDPDPIPMCGMPFHAADGYLKRLVEMGKKVAIGEQVEDPRLAKGIVKREITRIITPGLAADTVDSHESAWLVAIVGGPGEYGVALLDASTGDLRATDLHDLDGVLAEIARHEPREALLAPDVDDPELRSALGSICVTVLDDISVDERELERRFAGQSARLTTARGAVSAILRYASAHLRADLRNITALRAYTVGGAMGIDEATRRNLELFRPLRGSGRKGTLIGLLDECRTAMGGRLLREWVAAPLLDVEAIRSRHDAVSAYVSGGREEAVRALSGVGDIERICARVTQSLATPRDLVALRTSLENLPALARASAHPALAGRIPADQAADVADEIARWIVDEPPATSGEGGVIRTGAHAEIDRLRGLAHDAKGSIAAMEAQLRDETAVSSLKIRYNSVFGYYIEVSKANLHKVPERWHRKQTISTGERYITPELKEYEEAVLGADDRAMTLESECFVTLRERLSVAVPRLQAIARGVAELDCFGALAELAVRQRYVRPTVDESGDIDIRAGRHPVVEFVRKDERFVPNDCVLGARAQLVILTGPNMAGKSTLMRQIALITLLAQIGSFVPAAAARIGVVDRLFVRVGASDDLARGQSTFMVEMAETANILAGATSRSLVLLDEIGRGTSTYDGLSIAWAVAEDLHDRVHARAVFATHYHELAALSESCVRVRNLHVAVAEHGEKIVFLRKVKEGPASGSYGIQCARLAGMPGPVVARAKDLLKQLEKRRPRPEATQLSLFGGVPAAEPSRPELPLEDPVRAAVGQLNPDGMSPREAHEALYRLRALCDE